MVSVNISNKITIKKKRDKLKNFRILKEHAYVQRSKQ